VGTCHALFVASIELTDEELTLLRNALRAFLDDFGHEEADVVARIQALLAKLPVADGSNKPD
jgi:hypothetical protein